MYDEITARLHITVPIPSSSGREKVLNMGRHPLEVADDVIAIRFRVDRRRVHRHRISPVHFSAMYGLPDASSCVRHREEAGIGCCDCDLCVRGEGATVHR